MKQNRFCLLAAVLLCSLGLASAQQIETEMVDGHAAVAHEVLFRLQPWAANLRQQVVQPFDVATSQTLGRSGLIRLKSHSLKVPALLAGLSLNTAVAAVEPNYIVHASNTVPNDSDFGNLWGMQNTGQNVQGQTGVPFADISAVKAWDITTGSPSIVVGVVDTGVDYAHPDLSPNIWTAQTSYQITANGTLYTCPAGSHGFNFINLTCNPQDDNNHGSHVSGTIGARGNNNSGVAGVNWTTSILALKFLDQNGNGSISDGIDAIEAAVQLKSQGVNIRVLNNSWGVNAYSGALLQAVNDANAADILFVAAAGNNGQSNDGSPSAEYPASYGSANVISVAATDNQDNLASFSNYGAGSVHLGAPGVNVESTIIGSYGYLSGTSMATPHVTGAAALVLSACNLNTSQVKTAILSSVDPIPSLIGKTATGGRLDVYKALVYCGAAPPSPFTLSPSPTSLTVAPGGSAVSTVGVADGPGFNGTVSLSASGVPAGVTAIFSPSSVTGSGSSMLTLTTLSTTTQGTYSITISGTGGGQTFSTTVSLSIITPDFAVAASPSSISVAAGSSVSSSINVSAVNAFSGVVNLTASGLPFGVSASFSSNNLPGSGSSTLTITIASATALGQYPIAIQGASGNLIHTVLITLNVSAIGDFVLSAAPASVSAAVGGRAVSTISITPLNAFSGVVNFTADGAPFGVIASFFPATITGSGSSSLTFTVTGSTAPGVYSIAVQAVSGTLIHNTTVILTVNGPSDYSLSATPASVSTAAGGTVGSTVSVTALGGFSGTVNLAASGLPNGVTAAFAPVSIAGSGSSVLTLTASSSAAAGTYSFSVQGASGNLIHTASMMLTITAAADFSLSAAPASLGVAAGGSGNSTISATDLNGFNGTVSLTASGMPTGVTASFSSGSISGSSTSTLTLSASSSTATGTYQIAVKGVSGSLSHTATVSLTIAAADFTISASPATVAVSPGGSATSIVTIGAIGGFSGAVNLTANGLPTGATVSFSPASVSGSGNSTLTLTTSANTPPSGFTATIQGTSGSLVHTASLAVTFQASIVLPAGISVLPGSSVSYPVTLAAPATSNVYVALSSSDTTKVTLSSGNILFLAGSTTPSFMPKLNGINFGSATITASAFNYSPVTQQVLVTDSFTFYPASLSIGQGSAQYLTLTLAAPLSTDLTVNLSSSNPSVATTPAAVTIPANSVSASVRVTGVSAGSTTIHANALPAIADTTASVSVGAALTIVTPSLANGSLNTPYSQVLSATGGTAPLTWILISGALPTGLSLNQATGVIGGTPTVSVTNSPLTFKVTDSSFPAQTAMASFTLTISPNNGPTPSSITATKGTPQSATVNSPFGSTLVAVVKDINGNPLSGISVTFSAPGTGAGATFGGGTSATVTTDSSGSATTAVVANGTAGSYNVMASFAGGNTPAVFSLTNLAGPAAHISVFSGNSQNTTVNMPFSKPLMVSVTDSNGNAISGSVVTFTAPLSGATASFTGAVNTATTNSSGIASSVQLLANATPGAYLVTASVGGVATPASFSLVNIGPPASIAAVSGGGQSTSINTAFLNPLVVKVQDGVGNPISGLTVIFTVPASGASGSFNGSNMVVTNASGVATAPVFTANSTGGTYSVTASVAGLASSATFTLTNLSGIILPVGVTVAPGLSLPFSVTLGVPAASGGVLVILSSSDTSKVSFSTNNIYFPGGSTTPTVTPKINGFALGSVTITASAWTYQPVSQTVQVSESLSFFPGSVTVSAGNVQYVTLLLAAPAPTDLTINLSSGNPSAVTVPATATIPANATSLTVRLTAVGPGSATITAGAPPNVTAATLSVTVM